MKQRSKKGFSLIELIVVIAVIAAIAAVIVPQFGNMSSAAKNAADMRNVQLWNETYSNAYALVGDTAAGATIGGMTVTKVTGLDTTDASTYAKDGKVPTLDVVVTQADGTAMTFHADTFTIVGGSTYTFKKGTGLK
jgi:type IV pilus assembly protein PilA